MQKQVSLRETKQHGAVRFPFNIYPCTIPGDFPQVALHWQESMELIFVKRGAGLVQAGAVTHPAYMGDIFIFTPGTLHALRQTEGQYMEYENIIFDPELLGGAGDLCAEKYILPLQSGRLALNVHLTPDDLYYPQAANCLKEIEDANSSNWRGLDVTKDRTNANGNEGFWNIVTINTQNVRDRIALPKMVFLPNRHDELLKVPNADQIFGWDR